MGCPFPPSPVATHPPTHAHTCSTAGWCGQWLVAEGAELAATRVHFLAVLPGFRGFRGGRGQSYQGSEGSEGAGSRIMRVQRGQRGEEAES